MSTTSSAPKYNEKPPPYTPTASNGVPLPTYQQAPGIQNSYKQYVLLIAVFLLNHKKKLFAYIIGDHTTIVILWSS